MHSGLNTVSMKLACVPRIQLDSKCIVKSNSTLHGYVAVVLNICDNIWYFINWQVGSGLGRDIGRTVGKYIGVHASSGKSVFDVNRS